uniref:Uncharacterized protein n=1 Tax=Leersia perrieri TaxID=77586 RepID=A0A0D9V713_9ORYZ
PPPRAAPHRTARAAKPSLVFVVRPPHLASAAHADRARAAPRRQRALRASAAISISRISYLGLHPFVLNSVCSVSNRVSTDAWRAVLICAAD